MVRYHPFSEEVFEDPFPLYRELRDEAPAYYLEEFDCWFLSRFDDIWNALQDQRPFNSANGTTTTHLLTHQTPSAPNLSSLDGRAHTRVRTYFNPFFMPAAARALEPLVQELAREAVDAVVEKGECDAVTELGGRLSVRVACTILGIPLEEADQILDWVNAYFDREPGQRGTTKKGERAIRELGLHLFNFAKRRRADPVPGHDILSKLLGEEIDGALVDDAGIAAHLTMMVIGGSETFPKVFSAALCRLFEHPEQRAACIEDPGLIPDAFHETLRYDMPTHMLGRTLAQDLELHGQKLREGSGVMFLWGSANRDEREFDDPDTFDIRRRAPRILSFGHGQHMCLGAHMARLEGRVLIGEVLRRIPDYEVEPSGVERLRSEFFRGFARLPIRFGAPS